jgi:hypothetical protein
VPVRATARRTTPEPLTDPERVAGPLPHPELRYLLRAIESADGPTALPDPEGLDWEALLRIASAQRLLPALSAAWSRTGARVPEAMARRCHGEWIARAPRCLLLAGELPPIVSKLGQAGVRVLPFKGPVLAQRLYGSLAARPFSDLDLYLPRQQLWQAAAALERLGFVPRLTLSPRRRRSCLATAAEYVLVRPRHGIVVELHWQEPTRLVREGPDFEALWQRRHEVELAGTPVPCPSDEDHLLLLALHGGKHGWMPLRLVCDLAHLLQRAPSLDWSLITGEARRMNAEGSLLLGLSLAHSLLRAPLPAGIFDRIEASASLAPLAESVFARLCANPPSRWDLATEVRFHLGLLPTSADRWRYLRLLLLTQTEEDWSAIPLPDSLFPLYSLLRPWRLARKHLFGGTKPSTGARFPPTEIPPPVASPGLRRP